MTRIAAILALALCGCAGGPHVFVALAHVAPLDQKPRPKRFQDALSVELTAIQPLGDAWSAQAELFQPVTGTEPGLRLAVSCELPTPWKK